MSLFPCKWTLDSCVRLLSYTYDYDPLEIENHRMKWVGTNPFFPSTLRCVCIHYKK